jgi:hypothetical protein
MTEQCFKTSVARITRTAALLGASLLIASCASGVACHPSVCGSTGGGGTGGGGGGGGPTPFTSFSDVQANRSTIAAGISREGSARYYLSAGTGNVNILDMRTPTEGTGSLAFTVDGSGQITSLKLSANQSSVEFNSSNSTAIPLYLDGVPIATRVANSTGSNQAIFVDPYVAGFDYQSWGVWNAGPQVFPGTGTQGSVSAGAKTSPSSVPSSGTATFSGHAVGIFDDGSIRSYLADATFNVDFGRETVAMTTSNDISVGITQSYEEFTGVRPNDRTSFGYPSISGTMIYDPGSNIFSGFLTATDPNFPLSGAGSGVFYGPSANELGGTFFLSSCGDDYAACGRVLHGGFGGRR